MWRGLRRRCPRCGGSVIFERWMNAKEACPECDLRFEESGGDTWGFWVVLDRVFVVIPIVILFFGFAPAGKAARILAFIALVVPLIATMPNRQGLAIALDYLARRRQGQLQ